MSHPLFSLSDAEMEVVLVTGKAPASLQTRVRAARHTPPTDDERQSLLAALHGIFPQPDGFRWPWVALDSQLGLLPTGEMAVVLAQTGQGKTTFTGSLLTRIPRTPTLVFATETPDHRYLTQLAARKAGLHPDKVVQGDWGGCGYRLGADDARTRYALALEEVRARPHHIAPCLSLKASGLVAALSRAADHHPPQVIVVDHFQAIDHDLGVGVSAQQETLRVLHAFAEAHYVTLIVTNQAHLRGQGHTPKPHECIDVAGNFGGQTLMQYAAQVLGLHRVVVEITPAGIATTPQFLTEYQRTGGKMHALYDRERVAVDLCKQRYDAQGTSGNEVRLKFRQGQYWDAEE